MMTVTKDSEHHTRVSGLHHDVLIAAYSQGYFPMPDPENQQIGWYRPDPRAIIPLNDFHVSRSLRKWIKQNRYHVTFNQAFKAVMDGCSNRESTWIDDEIKHAYFNMHQLGYGHSVEIWQGEELIGGLYGVNFGKVFFAESMYSLRPNASKVALFYLVEALKINQHALLEVQFLTKHLDSMGAVEIRDIDYMKILKKCFSPYPMKLFEF